MKNPEKVTNIKPQQKQSIEVRVEALFKGLLLCFELYFKFYRKARRFALRNANL